MAQGLIRKIYNNNEIIMQYDDCIVNNEIILK